MKRKIKKTIIFVTGNLYKFQIAKNMLEGSGIKLIQKKLEVPEIQNESTEKVAAFSAQWASNVLKKPTVVSDGGCYIEALNGFPGPFIKYINKWLSAKDLLKIMENKKNRNIFWKSCLAYCEPGKKPLIFISCSEGKLAKKAGKNPYRKHYSWIDTLFIPKNFSRPLSEISDKKYLAFWGKERNGQTWQRLIKRLNKN